MKSKVKVPTRVEYDPNNPDHIELRQRHEQLLLERLEAEWKHLLSRKDGRYLVFELLEICEVHTTGCGMRDAQLRELAGKRAIGEEIFARIFTADPKAYILMQTEADERAEEIPYD